jgi:hypothetical protein
MGVHVRFETTRAWKAFIALGTVVHLALLVIGGLLALLVTGRLLARLETIRATEFLMSNEVGVSGTRSGERVTSGHESIYKARSLTWKMAEELV